MRLESSATLKLDHPNRTGGELAKPALEAHLGKMGPLHERTNNLLALFSLHSNILLDSVEKLVLAGMIECMGLAITF
jgi:hypothetical protein